MKRFKDRILAVLMIVAVALLPLLGGCSGSSSGGGSGAATNAASGVTAAALVLSAASTTIVAGNTTAVYATVADTDGNALTGAAVSFSLASGDAIYGTITASATTDASGVATATFTSTGQSGTVTVQASAGANAADALTLTVTPVVATLSISTDKTGIYTDGSNTATITANLLDANFVPIAGESVSFQTTGGQISAAGTQTDASGNASITLTSGANKSNDLITITATAQTQTASIPIRLTGSAVSLSIDSTSLSTSGAGSTTDMTVTVTDGGGLPIHNAEVILTQSGTGSLTINPTSGYTTNGILDVTISANSAGTITLSASALGDTAAKTITVSGNPFAFTIPSTSSVSNDTNTTRNLTVYSPSGNNVTLTTSMGYFEGVVATYGTSTGGFSPGDKTITVIPNGSNQVRVTFNAGSEAGLATIRAQDATNSSINDTLSVAIAAPAGDAAKVLLNVSPSRVAPSSGGVTNTATIEATVRNSANGGQIVADAPVMFSLFRTTGGGETVNPPIVYTDSSGVAETTFTSGNLTSNTRGVFCLATIKDAHITGPDDQFVFDGASSGPGRSYDFYTATNTIARVDGGNFVGEGFEVGDTINVFGSSDNDGDYTLATVTTTTLVTNEALVDEIDDNGDSINDREEVTILEEGTITRNDGGDFTADGYGPGDQIRVSGSDENDGEYDVAAVAATTLTLAADNSLSDEGSGPILMITDRDTAAVVPIKISGDASSVAIGIPLELEELNPSTYSSPMSVLVADSNGNPVSGATVTLSVWPRMYATGVQDTWLIDYDGPVRTAAFVNEDLNKNEFREMGEDTDGYVDAGRDYRTSNFSVAYYNDYGEYYVYLPGNGPSLTAGNQRLDPPRSAAGDVPPTVTTDANGVAQFNHVYQKVYAGYVLAEVTATVNVYGSEAQSSTSFWLPWLESDAPLLGDSPWGAGEAIWNTTP